MMRKNFIALLNHYYHLAIRLKLRGVWLLVKKRLNEFVRGTIASWSRSRLTEKEFFSAIASDFSNTNTFLKHIHQRTSPRFFIDESKKDEFPSYIRQTYPLSEERIVGGANEICNHRFDLLGSGPTDLGSSIDWHIDFKSGFRWNPHLYYAEIRAARFPGGFDIKVPWELSRCQHFVWLGQAYWFTRNEKYAREFCLQLEDWIKQNPQQFGVNWACTMDVAIRVVNWLWGYEFFKNSQTMDDNFRLTFFKSLLVHGRHIRANLEYFGAFKGNHYFADIVGLVYLGVFLPEFKETKEWLEFGLKELEIEVLNQFYPDGSNFEASTSYHRLMTEMVLSVTLLAQLNGHRFTLQYMERIEKTIDFILYITKPDGTAPLIGDQDNGRLHRLKVWQGTDREWYDFRYLFAIGAILFDRADLASAAADQWEEAIWLCGIDAVSHYATSYSNNFLLPNTRNLKIFPNSGLYIYRCNELYLAVEMGTNGQNGKGGHAHNDTLSFEFFASGQTWIQDPGTYTYTHNYDDRNLFRSTAYHNTVTLHNYEQNSFQAQELFEIKNEIIPRVLFQQSITDYDYLIGEIRRVTRPVFIQKRSFLLDRIENIVVIKDQMIGAETLAEFHLHFAAGLSTKILNDPYPGLIVTNAEGKVIWIYSFSASPITITTSVGWISTSYGKRRTAPIAHIKWHSNTDHVLAIVPKLHNTDPLQRLENALALSTKFQAT